MKLGRLPRPRNARFLRLATYTADPLPCAPPSWDGTPGATIAMYGNDALGDCTCAGLANLASIQTAGEGASLAFTDEDVKAFYFAVTGGQDTGAVEVDVLARVQSSGFPLDGRWRIKAWVAIDHADLDEVRSAAALFQGVYLGVELPDDWQETLDAGAGWDVTTAPNPDNGHALIVAGYDAQGAKLATWGQIVPTSWAWISRYVTEAYVLLDASRLAVDVLDGAQLAADVVALGGAS